MAPHYTKSTNQFMFSFYSNNLKKGPAESPSVAVLADEATDIACKSQFVITFTFLYKCRPVYISLKYEGFGDSTVEGLFQVLLAELESIDFYLIDQHPIRLHSIKDLAEITELAQDRKCWRD